MDRLPEISLQTAGESGEESVSTDGEESALPWPAWPASWQVIHCTLLHWNVFIYH